MSLREKLPVTWYNLGYDSNGKQKFTHTANLTTMKIFSVFFRVQFSWREDLTARSHFRLILLSFSQYFARCLATTQKKFPSSFHPSTCMHCQSSLDTSTSQNSHFWLEKVKIKKKTNFLESRFSAFSSS